jgi:hypothetical protein
MRRQRRLTATALVLAALVTPGEAHAYIDPGTGSYYVQLIAAGFGGIALLARQLWYRIRYPSARRPKDSSSGEASSEPRDGDPRSEKRAP